MSVPLALIRRIEALEAQCAEQARQIASLLGRRGQAAGGRELFQVVTAAVEGEEYPEDGNTFGIIFTDREFAPTPGEQDVTDHPRSASAQVVARSVNGGYFAEGDAAVAFFQEPPPGTTGKGRWWLLEAGEGDPILTGVLYEDLDALSFATVDEIALNAAGTARVYTGRRFEVWDFKLDPGESIDAGTIIDFVACEHGRYKWLTAFCKVSEVEDVEPAETPPESIAEESSYGFGPDPFVPFSGELL